MDSPGPGKIELLTITEGGAFSDSEDGSDVDLIKRSSGARAKRALLQRCCESEEEPGKERNGMKKEINLFSGVAYVAGGMIGSGIFITPNRILELTRSFGLTLIVWVIGAVMAMLSALCYLELVLVVKKSGLEYSYIKESYSFKKKHWSHELLGSVLAYMYLWSSTLIVRPSSIAIITLTSARYLVRPFFIDCEELPEKAVVVLALALMGILGLVNCFGLKFAARMMSLFTSMKVLTVVFIMLLGLVGVIRRRGDLPSGFLNPFENLHGEAPSIGSVALSFYSVQFAYDGWYHLNSAMDETKNVKRTLPLSMYIGVAIVAVSYLIINTSFFATLDFSTESAVAAVALPFGKAVVGTAGVVIISILVSMSAFGAANGTLLSSSRILFVASREGNCPKFMSGLHNSARTPVPAIVFEILLSMLIATVGTLDNLIEGTEFVVNLYVGLSIIGVFILRYTRPKEPRIFSAWFIIPVAVVATVITALLLVVPVVQSPGPAMINLAISLSAIPVYFIFVMEKPYKIRPKFLDRISSVVSKYVSLVLNTHPMCDSLKKLPVEEHSPVET